MHPLRTPARFAGETPWGFYCLQEPENQSILCYGEGQALLARLASLPGPKGPKLDGPQGTPRLAKYEGSLLKQRVINHRDIWWYNLTTEFSSMKLWMSWQPFERGSWPSRNDIGPEMHGSYWLILFYPPKIKILRPRRSYVASDLFGFDPSQVSLCIAYPQGLKHLVFLKIISYTVYCIYIYIWLG
jgi:hypothetical protein